MNSQEQIARSSSGRTTADLQPGGAAGPQDPLPAGSRTIEHVFVLK